MKQLPDKKQEQRPGQQGAAGRERCNASHVLNSRVKIRIFTLIELLMKYTCQPCNYVLYYKRE